MAKSKKLQSELLSIKGAAAHLNCSVQWLYQCRHAGTGPRCRQIETTGLGKGPTLRLFYDPADLDTWHAKRTAAKERAKRSKKTKTKKARSARTHDAHANP